MLLRKIKLHKFDYTPRYLKADKNETEGEKRIKFKRFITVNRGSPSIL